MHGKTLKSWHNCILFCFVLFMGTYWWRVDIIDTISSASFFSFFMIMPKATCWQAISVVHTLAPVSFIHIASSLVPRPPPFLSFIPVYNNTQKWKVLYGHCKSLNFSKSVKKIFLLHMSVWWFHHLLWCPSMANICVVLSAQERSQSLPPHPVCWNINDRQWTPKNDLPNIGAVEPHFKPSGANDNL